MKESHFTSELVAIHRFFGLFEREAVCCGSVTVAQCIALQQLLDGVCDITRLAAGSGVTNGAMTRLVDGLESREWVRRVRGADDRRRVDVELTAAGRAEAEHLREATEMAIRGVLQRIPRAKHTQLLESVRLLRRAIEEARASWSGCDVSSTSRAKRSTRV